MKILITGTAGFIGFHAVKALVLQNHIVVGIDNINAYYPTSLKYDRLKECGIAESNIHYNVLSTSSIWSNYRFAQLDLEDAGAITQLFHSEKFDLVIHLAAQAGVRYSLENPQSYIKSNIGGFLNILEACRNAKVKKLIYASSSSVYGLSDKKLLSIDDRVDAPESLYAATKKSNELMAHAYSKLYSIQTIGLRFFTVYGPWGRPDMAPFLFSDAILNNKPVKLFNKGIMKRDFTFIDDIIKGICNLCSVNIENNYSIFNIGNNSPIELIDFISCLEKEFNVKAKFEFLDMQPGDVLETCADTKELEQLTGYIPNTSIDEGIHFFAEWFKKYYKY